MITTNTTSQLFNPHSVFVTRNGEIYIADYSNHVIRKILKNGNIVRIAGNRNREFGYSGDHGPATDAKLCNPSSVFVSSNDEVYIADSCNNCIRKILRNGNIITIAGNGQAGYSGDNGPAIDAKLDCPHAVFVSSNDEVYIADYFNNAIRKILRNGNIITIVGNGKPGFSGENGPAIDAKLQYPQSVFVTSNDEVYIADSSNCALRKILLNGNIVTLAGNRKRVFGYSGDHGPATNAEIGKPSSVFVTSNDEVYIADIFNNVIRKILVNGNIITIAGNGKAGYSGDNGPAIDAKLDCPNAVFVTSNDEVYIADKANVIRKILRNGNIITIAGNGSEGYSGDSTFDFSLYPHIGGYLYDNAINNHFEKKFNTMLFDCTFKFN